MFTQVVTQGHFEILVTLCQNLSTVIHVLHVKLNISHVQRTAMQDWEESGCRLHLPQDEIAPARE